MCCPYTLGYMWFPTRAQSTYNRAILLKRAVFPLLQATDCLFKEACPPHPLHPGICLLEFVQSLHVLPQLLWVQMCVCPAVSLELSAASASYHPCSPSSAILPKPWEERCDRDIPFGGEHFAGSSLHLDQCGLWQAIASNVWGRGESLGLGCSVTPKELTHSCHWSFC